MGDDVVEVPGDAHPFLRDPTPCFRISPLLGAFRSFRHGAHELASRPGTGEGSEDIVLLPGFGTASPVLDFEPLVPELAQDDRVIVVEPFGYGLSDGTDRARTTDNIVTETHAALQELGVDDYVLMGHSIAGIYGIQFANRYPDEVRAFMGIDSSVPRPARLGHRAAGRTLQCREEPRTGPTHRVLPWHGLRRIRILR
ncbi:alpha/beta fold hydrolase [Microbacterium maritypicum]|uniref:alpha/beta fold hydrolase n=1 Tax=Microbacterium maritypicum TaxID=33918 RepID=UPI0022E71F1A|nr:alpha/beta hydrolase [Microbacterium liquefaciens]